MTHILTLVSSDRNLPLNQSHIDVARGFINDLNGKTPDITDWLEENKAVDLPFSNVAARPLCEALQIELDKDKIDVFVTEVENRRKKLLLADMDSTIVTGETLDELAAYAGLKDEISAITTRAMNGELDFEAALKNRVGLLKGLSQMKLEETLGQTRLSKGAETFVKTMGKHGAECVLVSGGFTFFTESIAKIAGFHHSHGNILEVENGVLTGHVILPILDKNAKLRFLNEYADAEGINLSETLTIGDGANDLPMLEAAGLGIGYYAKQVVRDEIPNCILHGDLTAALYAQGYRTDEFAV